MSTKSPSCQHGEVVCSVLRVIEKPSVRVIILKPGQDGGALQEAFDQLFMAGLLEDVSKVIMIPHDVYMQCREVKNIGHEDTWRNM
jgi:hypothetical protein